MHDSGTNLQWDVQILTVFPLTRVDGVHRLLAVSFTIFEAHCLSAACLSP